MSRGETLSRERLIDELWGERPPKAVAAELRVYVAKLRKALGSDVVETRKDGYALVVGPERVDADRFERAARRGAALLAAGDPAAAAPVLRDALGLWRGPLLADFTHEPWVASEARRLDELRLLALEERLEAELALGLHAAVVPELTKLVEEQPYRERLHGQLMLALYRSGRQADALGIYRRLHRLLRDELGLEPSAEIQRLERRILIQEPTLELRERPPGRRGLAEALGLGDGVEFDSTQPAPFVGRNGVLEALLRHLRRALDGGSQIAFVHGEAGSGKTALLAEFARRAARADPTLLIIGGATGPATGAVDPYAPFRRVLRMLVGDLQDALATELHAPDQERRLWQASADALEAVVEHGIDLVETIVPGREVAARARTSAPEIAQRLDDAVAAAGRRRSTQALPPGRIREELLSVLDQISRRRAGVLLLDDLQWADPSTLDLLARLVDERRGSRLMVVAAFRPEDVLAREDSGAQSIERLIRETRRRRGDVILDLDRAAAAEARAFVDALLDLELNEIGEEVRSALTDRSGGHALFAVELVRELKATGSLRRDTAGRWVEAARVTWDRWPARIEGLLAEKFSRLDAHTLDALRIGSVEGEEFTADVVAAVEGVRVDAVVRALSGDPTARNHIVRATGAQRIAGVRVFRYRFRHALYQRFLYEHLDDVQRPHLHERVASSLEALASDTDAGVDLALAHQFERAGLYERAIPYLHRCGLRAVRVSANEQAVEHFSRAIQLTRELKSDGNRSRIEAELQVELAVAFAALRGFGAAEVEAAYARATDLLIASAPAREHHPIHFGLSLVHGARGNFDRSTRNVERMFDIASNDDDEALTLQALHASWADSFTRGRIDDAVAAASRGVAIYDREAHHELTFRYGNHDPGVCALAGLGLALAARGDAAGAVERAHQAVSLAHALDHSFTRVHSRALAAWALQIIGDWDAALSEAERALSLEGDVDAPYFFALARNVRGWALCRSGCYDEGAATLERALDSQLRGAARTYAALTAAYLCEAHVRVGRPDRGRSAIREMRSLSRLIGPFFATPELRRVEAQWLSATEREGEARRQLLQAVGVARQQGSWALALRAALVLARRPSSEREPRADDLELLADLFRRVPASNESGDVQDARALLSGSVVVT